MPSSHDLTVHQLRVVRALAHHRSISRTANALSVPQPAISRLIARVEALVGLPLFNRSSGGVSLTQAGERFLIHAQEMLDVHDLALSEAQQMQGKLIGEVRIAAPESVGDILFAPLIKHFQLKHPEAVVRAIASYSASIPSMLDNAMVGIGIIADTHSQPPGRCELLCREQFYLVGQRDDPELARADTPLAKAARLPLIINAMTGGFRTVLDDAFARTNVTPNIRIEIDANTPLLDLVAAGEGYSILPFSVLANRPQRKLLSISRIVKPVMSRRLSLVTATGQATTPLTRAVARQIKISMKDLAAEARWLM